MVTISVRTELDLQRAMYQLLEERSMSQITVEQICTRALIHRSSFYRYYTDKFDLLTQLVMRAIEDLLAAEQANAAGSGVMARFIGTHTQILRHLLVTNTEGDNNRSQQVVNACFLAIAQTGAHDHVFVMIRKAAQPDLTAYLVSGAITSIVQWSNSERLDGASPETQAAIQTTLATFFSLEQHSV